jgi:hypothetical protein
MLALDVRLQDLRWQYAIGALTFALLFVAGRLALPEERRQAWACVLVATGFEIIGSQVWGLYRYRLGNLPLFVPPGHGLCYLFSLTAARTPLLRDHGRAAAWVVLGAATAWALAGLSLLPALTGRYDLLGAASLPVFAWFLLRSPRYRLFTAIFVAVADLEIAGTLMGNWQWMPVVPFTTVTSGNPPSVIAGGYCVIDGSVVVATLAAAWLWTRRPRLSRRPLRQPEPLLEPALEPEAA